MYPYLYPCYYCAMADRQLMQPVDPMKTKPMMRGAEDHEEDKSEKRTMPPMQQMPGMGQQMPGMMDMSKMNMGKIQADTQEIVRMFEQSHPDIIMALTRCGISVGQARQYLSTIVQMTLMHHMMHQM